LINPVAKGKIMITRKEVNFGKPKFRKEDSFGKPKFVCNFGKPKFVYPCKTSASRSLYTLAVLY